MNPSPEFGMLFNLTQGSNTKFKGILISSSSSSKCNGQNYKKFNHAYKKFRSHKIFKAIKKKQQLPFEFTIYMKLKYFY